MPARQGSRVRWLNTASRLTIGKKQAIRAGAEREEEQSVTREYISVYRLRWEESLKPFLERKFPELKVLYQEKSVC